MSHAKNWVGEGGGGGEDRSGAGRRHSRRRPLRRRPPRRPLRPLPPTHPGLELAAPNDEQALRLGVPGDVLDLAADGGQLVLERARLGAAAQQRPDAHLARNVAARDVLAARRDLDDLDARAVLAVGQRAARRGERTNDGHAARAVGEQLAVAARAHHSRDTGEASAGRGWGGAARAQARPAPDRRSADAREEVSASGQCTHPRSAVGRGIKRPPLGPEGAAEDIGGRKEEAGEGAGETGRAKRGRASARRDPPSTIDKE